jgi:hypothetical protein
MHNLLLLFAGLAFIGATQEVQSHHTWGFAITFGFGMICLLLHGDVQRKLGADPKRPLEPGRYQVVHLLSGRHGGMGCFRVVLMRHHIIRGHEYRLAEIAPGMLPCAFREGDTIIVGSGEPSYYAVESAEER